MSEVATGFDDAAFARRLRSARLALGLSEEEAASAAGRSARTWRRYEETGAGHVTRPLIKFVKEHRINLFRHGIELDWLIAGQLARPPRLRIVSSQPYGDGLTPPARRRLRAVG